MRRLSGKTINSLALCVALAAPLVYLFGTLFMYLAGAHGNMQLANEETEVRYLTEPNFTKGYRLSNVTMEQLVPSERNAVSGIYQVNQSQQYTITLGGTFEQNSALSIYQYNEQGDFIAYSDKNPNSGTTFVYTLEQGTKYVRFSYRNPYQSQEGNYWANFSAKITGYTKEINKPSQYLFGQFFAFDNFLAESGRKVLSGEPQYGFEPIGELVRYTDANMLHLANLSYGPLVIGYTYYCAHVIIVDLIFYIGSFIPRLIKKTINKLEGGLD